VSVADGGNLLRMSVVKMINTTRIGMQENVVLKTAFRGATHYEKT
jgi:hypothetical protein